MPSREPVASPVQPGSLHVLPGACRTPAVCPLDGSTVSLVWDLAGSRARRGLLAPPPASFHHALWRRVQSCLDSGQGPGLQGTRAGWPWGFAAGLPFWPHRPAPLCCV